MWQSFTHRSRGIALTVALVLSIGLAAWSLDLPRRTLAKTQLKHLADASAYMALLSQAESAEIAARKKAIDRVIRQLLDGANLVMPLESITFGTWEIEEFEFGSTRKKPDERAVRIPAGRQVPFGSAVQAGFVQHKAFDIARNGPHGNRSSLGAQTAPWIAGMPGQLPAYAHDAGGHDGQAYLYGSGIKSNIAMNSRSPRARSPHKPKRNKH